MHYCFSVAQIKLYLLIFFLNLIDLQLDSITIESFLRFLIYSASKITQTFLYGWAGTALTSQVYFKLQISIDFYS